MMKTQTNRLKASGSGVRHKLGLVLALLLLPGIASASKADAFENKIVPVSGHLFLKRLRFEVAPTINVSVNDAFYKKYLFGAKANFHIREQFTIGAQFVGGVSSPAGSTLVCPAQQGCRPATDAQMYQVPGLIKMMGGLEAGWSPVYGKLNVFAERVIHFDLSLLAGGDYISYQEAQAKADAERTAASGVPPPTLSTFGGHVGLGGRVFLNEFLAVRVEVKDYIYSVNVGNLGHSDLQHQLFAEFGLSIFFPFRFSHE